MTVIEYCDNEFVQLFFFEKYMISQIEEDVLLDIEKNKALIKAANSFYEGAPFIYITNRVHAYNVSPLVYTQSSNLPNLLGLCIVAKSGIGQETARFEGKFFNKDFLVCEDLDEGVNWAVQVFKNAKD